MKLRLKLLNIFYLAFSIVALAAYALNYNSFMRATFSYKVNSDLLLEESIDDTAFEELGISTEDLFSDLDTIVFEVEVNVSYANLLSAWTETGYAFETETLTAAERYAVEYIFVPAFENAPDWLYDDLVTISKAALNKMIEKSVTAQLERYSLAVVGTSDYFQAMKDNPENVDKIGENRFIGSVNSIIENMFIAVDDDMFFNGRTDLDDNVIYPGLKREMHPYFTAIKNPANSEEQARLTECFNDMVVSVENNLYAFGIINDEDGSITYIEEAIGNILQRLVDHTEYEEVDEDYDYEDYDDEYEAFNEKFFGKFFAPLKTYIEGENDIDNTLAELFFNVVKNSNANGGERDTVFIMIALAAQVFGVLLVLFVLAWAIKLIMVIISFFRQKPYIRMNPLFIITGTIEALLALLTLSSVIIYNIFDINAIRTTIPIVQAIVPLGLSFQFIFACWVPGVVAILNLLFSILYGPVKKKFKQDARDEILYSTDFNDYE